jgi:hypothetical protein
MKIPKTKNCGKSQITNILSFLSSPKMLICFRNRKEGETIEKLISNNKNEKNNNNNNNQWELLMNAVDVEIPMRFKNNSYQQAQEFKRFIGLTNGNYTVVHWLLLLLLFIAYIYIISFIVTL